MTMITSPDTMYLTLEITYISLNIFIN